MKKEDMRYAYQLREEWVQIEKEGFLPTPFDTKLSEIIDELNAQMQVYANEDEQSE